MPAWLEMSFALRSSSRYSLNYQLNSITSSCVTSCSKPDHPRRESSPHDFRRLLPPFPSPSPTPTPPLHQQPLALLHHPQHRLHMHQIRLWARMYPVPDEIRRLRRHKLTERQEPHARPPRHLPLGLTDMFRSERPIKCSELPTWCVSCVSRRAMGMWAPYLIRRRPMRVMYRST